MDKLLEFEPHKGNILWYRGHRSTTWNVDPTIWREYGRRDERNFVHRFRTRAAIRTLDAPKYDDHAHWLTLMRHYGLPTRLMDWSRSPLVALYFALEYLLEDPKVSATDSVLWVLQPHLLNATQRMKGIGSLTPSISSTTCSAAPTGAFYDGKEPNTVVAAMAHDVDLRIFVQQGCFTIHSNRTPLNKQPGHGRFLIPMLVPAGRARSMANELFVAGLRKGDIYPDLTNLAAELVETQKLFS
ncbi:MAG: FRG domain-containing protein [Xanthobacteraceae bacterium]|nr:FRG domain-containing protein [Xanthobacteraceae bacterium]